MMFAQHYLVGNADTRWRQYHEKHREALWSNMKTLLTDLTAPPQLQSNDVFQQLHNANQGIDQFLTQFAAYITNTVQGTKISDYEGWMFLCTGMHPEIRAALLRGVEHPMFNALVNTCLYVEDDLSLEADYLES